MCKMLHTGEVLMIHNPETCLQCQQKRKGTIKYWEDIELRGSK